MSSSWDVLAAAGEPRASIRVRNLRTTLSSAAQDAWGRSGRSQPALLSAEVVLLAPFADAASSDTVAADTVHYGTLSKAMLATIKKCDLESNSLGDVVDSLWVDLVGGAFGYPVTTCGTTAVVDVAATRHLTLSIHLPKASLLGEGVSLTATALLSASTTSPWSTTLRLHRLRVPTLVGVHAHERTAKQAVIASIALDGQQVPGGAGSGTADAYTQLEALVVQTMEASSFETLEALATHLARTILTKFGQTEQGEQPTWNVHVALEKPIAVPYADAPIVEVRMGVKHL